MGKYFASERLKFKRTFSKKLTVVAPLMVAILALLFGGIMQFQSMLLYWWYAFILPGVLSLLCALANQREGKGEKYSHIFSMPIDLKKFWIAKNMVCIYLFFIMEIVLFVVGYILMFLAPDLRQYSNGSMLFGVLLIFITALWQFPLCFFLSKKIGMFVTIIGNTVLGFLSIIALGDTIVSWFWPYCWTTKCMCYGLGIKMSGEAGTMAPMNHIGQIALLCTLSICLCMVLIVISAKWFAKLEEK